ncbi:MAG: FAD-dependent monooxygenase [Rhizobiaceae bacterium]|nr:FAD-dependent monooxygenase [Rhizobiaceae bacterium]
MESNSHIARRTILVSGAGIAGLASALYISRAGYRVEIFEQSPSLDPIGSGLQLSPNAMHVLSELGVDWQVKSIATAPPAIIVNNASNAKTIVEIPLGQEVTSNYGQPYLVVHRADLQEILKTACQDDHDIHIRLGMKVRDAVAHPNGVSILADSASGTHNYRGIALVAADGVHSTIRGECFESKGPRSTGTTALRALIPSQEIPKELRTGNIVMWLSPNIHAVLYPVRAQRYYNIVLSVPENFAEIVGDSKITGAKISDALKGWSSQFTQLLNIKTDWNTWPLMAAPNLKSWQEGCIVLIGDAAHAMTPHAAQGAAMGLEDASVLGWALKKEKSPELAFNLFQKHRLQRTNKVRRLSATNRIIYQLPMGLTPFRNAAMKLLGGKRLFNRQDWIYRWRPPGQTER